MTYYAPAIMLRPWVQEDLKRLLADAPKPGGQKDEWLWIGRAMAWFEMLTEGRLDLYDAPPGTKIVPEEGHE